MSAVAGNAESGILAHHQAAANVWSLGGEAYNEVSFGISDALAHAAQRLNPKGTGLWGWRYEPRSFLESDAAKQMVLSQGGTEKDWKAVQHEADISVTTWVVMALKSGELAGLTVPHAALEGAMEFTKYVTIAEGEKKGKVAYMDPLQVDRKLASDVVDNFKTHFSTLAALGMCSRTFIEKNIDDPILPASAAVPSPGTRASRSRTAATWAPRAACGAIGPSEPSVNGGLSS